MTKTSGCYSDTNNKILVMNKILNVNVLPEHQSPNLFQLYSCTVPKCYLAMSEQPLCPLGNGSDVPWYYLVSWHSGDKSICGFLTCTALFLEWPKHGHRMLITLLILELQPSDSVPA